MWKKARKGGGGGVQQRNREIKATVHKMTIWTLLINAITKRVIGSPRESH